MKPSKTKGKVPIWAWFSGWWFQPTPLKNDGVKVSWDDYSIPFSEWKFIIHSCSSHHQPVLFQGSFHGENAGRMLGFHGDLTAFGQKHPVRYAKFPREKVHWHPLARMKHETHDVPIIFLHFPMFFIIICPLVFHICQISGIADFGSPMATTSTCFPGRKNHLSILFWASSSVRYGDFLGDRFNIVSLPSTHRDQTWHVMGNLTINFHGIFSGSVLGCKAKNPAWWSQTWQWKIIWKWMF